MLRRYEPTLLDSLPAQLRAGPIVIVVCGGSMVTLDLLRDWQQQALRGSESSAPRL
jgi:hypothetical protein|eukprot:SAG25_NODE_560_length_6917_cov_7.195365_3_plen_56_part_00